MQEISKDILIKSLMFNTYYPRDLDMFKGKIISFSTDLNDDCDAFISDNFDEIGYARRYSKKFLFFKNISEDNIVKASIYGADGLIFSNKCDKKILNLARNCGFHLAILAKSNFDLLKAVAKDFDIVIADKKLLNNTPDFKYKGELR